MYSIDFPLASETHTDRMAQLIAQAVPNNAILALVGDLGTGKTTFTQHLAKHYGIDDTLASPTFTLLNEYPRPQGGYFIHGDLYRLSSTRDIAELGVDDYFQLPKTITVLEWADRAPTIFPPNTLWLTFAIANNRRIARLTIPTRETWHDFETHGL